MAKSNDSLCIAICSSGLDSTTTLVWQMRQKKKVEIIHFNYGQLCEKAEEDRIKKIANFLNVKVHIVDIPWLGKLGGSPLTDPQLSLPKGFDSAFSLGCWVPARNVVFLSLAAALCERLGGGELSLGGESSESFYKDNTVEFAKLFTKMLKLGCLKQVSVVMPLANWTKVEELRWGTENGVPYHLTWSCDRGESKAGEFIPCGECGCCNSRRFCYHTTGIKDTQVYLNDSYFSEVFLKDMVNLKKMEKKLRMRYV